MPIAFPMEIPPILVQLGGSLVAILALTGLARWLGLGTASGFSSAEEVIEAAEEVRHGFNAVAVAIDSSGSAALARNRGGEVMLLRLHGNKIVGRVLGPLSSARIAGDRLRIDSGERRFGTVELEIEDASAWMQAVDAIKPPRYA